MWIADFFMQTDGRTAFLFDQGFWIFWLNINLHILLLPLALYGVWKVGFERRSLLPTMFFIFVLLGATYIFTPVEQNINCVFRPCEGHSVDEHSLQHFLKTLFFWLALTPVGYLLWRFIFQAKFIKKRTAS
jgi:hypothetical protein